MGCTCRGFCNLLSRQNTKISEKFTNIDSYIPDQNQVPKFTSFALMTNKEVLEMMSAMKNRHHADGIT